MSYRTYTHPQNLNGINLKQPYRIIGEVISEPPGHPYFPILE